MHSCVVKARGGLYHLNSLGPVFFILFSPPTEPLSSDLAAISKNKNKKEKKQKLIFHI